MKTKYLFLLLFTGIIAAGTIISLALMEETALPANGGEIKKFSSVDELKTYTISSREVIMSRLDDPGTPLNSLALPSPVYRWMYPPVE